MLKLNELPLKHFRRRSEKSWFCVEVCRAIVESTPFQCASESPVSFTRSQTTTAVPISGEVFIRNKNKTEILVYYL